MRYNRLWILSAFAGIVGALVIFGAAPGINWMIWTIVAAAGLIAFRRPNRALLRALALPLGFAIILSGAFAVTTAGPVIAADFLVVTSLLALTLMIAREPCDASDYGAIRILTAPLQALAYTLRGATSAALGTFESATTVKMSPAMRGSLLAVPVVIVLALLFAAADPVFASGRDAVYNVFGAWDNGRLIFGIVLALFVGGAYTASLAVPATPAVPSSTQPHVRTGLTERRVVLGAAAAISWLFVLLQVSYLFRTAPGSAGSGITFAEYARRGFAELAFAATGSALLIVAAYANTSMVSSRGKRAGGGALTVSALTLLAAVACILASAFHRVSLYEDAYGFSTARVYAQAYMVLTLAILLAIAWHVARTFDVRALARNIMTIALITFAFLAYWNVDAWVARANVNHYANTTKLDVDYLLVRLSPDAYPALVEVLPTLTQPIRAKAIARLVRQVEHEPTLSADRWFEWNLRRSRARDALRTLGIGIP